MVFFDKTVKPCYGSTGIRR